MAMTACQLSQLSETEGTSYWSDTAVESKLTPCLDPGPSRQAALLLLAPGFESVSRAMSNRYPQLISRGASHARWRAKRRGRAFPSGALQLECIRMGGSLQQAGMGSSPRETTTAIGQTKIELGGSDEPVGH